MCTYSGALTIVLSIHAVDSGDQVVKKIHLNLQNELGYCIQHISVNATT